MTAPLNSDTETTPSRAVVVSDACSRFRPPPETTAAWYAALDWCRLRGEGHDPHHAALANLSEKLERERDAARDALRVLAAAVGSSKVPQTVEDAAMQIFVTIGPALDGARKLLDSIPEHK